MKKIKFLLISGVLLMSPLKVQINTVNKNGFSINSGISQVNKSDFTTLGPGLAIQGKFFQTLSSKLNLVSSLGYSSHRFNNSIISPEIGTGGVIQTLDLGIQIERVLMQNSGFKITTALGLGTSAFTTSAFVNQYVPYTSKYTGETWYNLMPQQVKSVSFPIVFPLSISVQKSISKKFDVSLQSTYNLCPFDNFTNFTTRSTTLGLFYKLN
jgi:hypothetical protein